MLGVNRQVQYSIRTVEFRAEKLQGRAMRNVILMVVVALGMQWPAAAMDRPGDSSTTSADDLSGKWEVSPKDGATSTGRCNTCIKSLCRRLEV